ncbi:MAG: hypothetical protein NTW19_05205 [Planctomycetota bacterium]|nr:hypothetical protein [Planctomycetota bacterium]
MISWVLHFLGVKDAIITRLDKAELLWARPTMLWIGLALLVPAAVFVVLRHRRNLPNVSPALRGLMSACRIGVLLLLVLVLGGPYLRLDEPIKQKPLLAVVIDESGSMALPAGPFEPEEADRLARAAGLVEKPKNVTTPPPVPPEARKKIAAMTRTDLLDAVLKQSNDSVIKPLAERFDIKAFRVARQVRQSTFGGDAPPPLEAVDGEDTDLGEALNKAIDESVGRNLAGVVLFSDGRWTTGPDPLAVLPRLRSVGGTGKSGAAPLWSIPVGATKAVVDVAVTDVLAPAHVAKGDTITVIATVDSQGLDTRAVQVKLTGAEGKVLDSKPLTLRATENQQVALTFIADEPGTSILTASVDAQPEETVKLNNAKSVFVEVDTERLKLLYLEGSPRWDFRFLDHELRRDSGIENTMVMEAQLVAQGATEENLATLAHIPQDAKGFAEFNTVILGDISPALLPPKLQEQLAKAVEEDGLGLIIQAGVQHMPQEFYRGPLGRLLPVKLEFAPDAATGNIAQSAPLPGIEAPAFAPYRMKVTATGAIHPAFRLYDDATQNRTVWSRMPEFYWSSAALDGGPTTTVLARVDGPGEPRPMIAEANAGRGRVFYVGGDSTYRWRRNVGSHLFYRFWGQAIRYVARDKKRAADKSWIEAYPARLEPGESVTIQLYAVDREGQPLTTSQVQLQVAGADFADQFVVTPGGQPGFYRGQWQPKHLGQYRLGYTDARGGAVSAAVVVSGSGREVRRPSVDRDLLGTLADNSGGELLELDQLSRLPALVKGEPIEIHQPHEDTIWDNWLTLVLLVSLYCIDVGARRLLGLM